MLPEGCLLKQGEYRVVGYMASGGFGNTYQAEHNGRLHKRMAVKEFFMRGLNTRQGTCVAVSVADNQSDYQRMLNKFFKEAQRLAQIDHPHIVEVIDFFEENGTAYYVMKLIDGQPLNKVMSQHGPMDVARVADVLKQVLSALKYVHAQHLYHLDLKPSNIMQNAEGHCWLIDFGASKQMSDDNTHTLTTTALPYTPRYAPLEQVGQNMEDIGPWTDFYALGATLYHLLTAQLPPKPDRVNEDGEAAFNFPTGIDANMRGLILWMMQPRRRERPQSVVEIEQWLAGHPLGSSAVPPDVPTVKSADDSVPTVKSADDNLTKASTTSKPTRLANKSPLPSLRSKLPWLWLGFGGILVLVLVGIFLSQSHQKDAASPNSDEVTADLSYCPNGNHPHAIDLGLPSGTKWACCNIGASTPADDGDYFRWGETKPMKEGDTSSTYPYTGMDIGSDISGTRYDAASANWGTDWRMPTQRQIQELIDNCTYEWTVYNRTSGAKVSGRNGHTIFLPASGYRDCSNGSLRYVGSLGHCWSASAYGSGTDYARPLYFPSSFWDWSYCYRALGFPVRAVAE